ncbi:MAG: hypothetical protein FWF86_09195, partial [Clostridia bacterium]|nr:hypothetical protein [Clostridia bacterium]
MNPVSLDDMARLTQLLETAGRDMPSPQAQMAAKTNVVLSSLMLLIASEAIACMSAGNGMPWGDSYGLTAAVMAETASLLSEKGIHPAQLKDMLCQPGSLAIEALQALEQARLRTAMINACNEACVQI